MLGTQLLVGVVLFLIGLAAAGNRANGPRGCLGVFVGLVFLILGLMLAGGAVVGALNKLG